ncbi:hypothetical protein FRC01_004513, partial [Tulasnella sp. 417]
KRFGASEASKVEVPKKQQPTRDFYVGPEAASDQHQLDAATSSARTTTTSNTAHSLPSPTTAYTQCRACIQSFDNANVRIKPTTDNKANTNFAPNGSPSTEGPARTTTTSNTAHSLPYPTTAYTQCRVCIQSFDNANVRIKPTTDSKANTNFAPNGSPSTEGPARREAGSG